MSNVTWQPGVTLAEIEKQIIFKALNFFGGNKTQAAIALGVSVKTLYNKLEQYETEDAEKASQIPETPQHFGLTIDEQRNGRKEARVQTTKTIDDQAPQRLSMEPASRVAPERILPMSERQEVQTLPPKVVGTSNSRKRSY